MALLNAVQNSVQALSGGNQRSSGNQVTLTRAQFFDSNQDNLKSGKFNLLGAYTVGAKREMEVGNGTNALESMEQGRPFMDFQNTNSNPVDGMVRIRHEDPYGNNGRTILEERTEEFRESDKQQRIVLPRASSQGHPRVSEDSRIGIYLDPDTDNATVSASNSKIRLPTTRYSAA